MRYVIPAAASVCLTTALFFGFSAKAAEPSTQPTSQPTTAPSATINWDEASKHIGETVTITGPVISTHVSGNKKNVSLNVGKDFPDPERLTILMPNDAPDTSPDDTYKDKTIVVTGKLEVYKKTTEIKAKTKEVSIQK